MYMIGNPAEYLGNVPHSIQQYSPLVQNNAHYRRDKGYRKDEGYYFRIVSLIPHVKAPETCSNNNMP